MSSLHLQPCDPAYHWCEPGCLGHFVVCEDRIIAHGETPAAAVTAAQQSDDGCQGCPWHPNCDSTRRIPPALPKPAYGIYERYTAHGDADPRGSIALCEEHAAMLHDWQQLDEHDFYSAPDGQPCMWCESRSDQRRLAELMHAHAERVEEAARAWTSRRGLSPLEAVETAAPLAQHDGCVRGVELCRKYFTTVWGSAVGASGWQARLKTLVDELTLQDDPALADSAALARKACLRLAEAALAQEMGEDVSPPTTAARNAAVAALDAEAQ